jgi:hypothetical protein
MIWVAALVVAAFLNATDAFAAEPSLMRVMVVPSVGQLSLVVELSDEARRVSTEQTSATELMLEAGPIALPVQRQILSAPSGLALLQQVAVAESVTENHDHQLEVRITMKRSAASTVRVVGRRIYIDFAVADAGMPAAPSRQFLTTAAQEQHQPGVAPATNRAPVTGTASRQALSDAASKFERIRPFLMSATTAPAPNPTVLSAVSDAITDVRQSLQSVHPAAADAGSLQMLTSAVTMAAEAVSADFHGDRASRAQQSLAVFAAAKAQIQ